MMKNKKSGALLLRTERKGEHLVLGTLTVSEGEKKTGSLPVPGTEYELPLTVICGGEGPVTLITAGIHSAEYPGIQAAIELAEETEPEQVKGTLIIVPVVNVSGIVRRCMSMVYEDNKNLNREFPGSPDGTAADRICHTVTTELFSRADYYLDLHSGDAFEELVPYIYYVGPVDAQVREKAYAMASCADVRYMVESQCTAGGAYNHASTLGIPSILLERGCRGLWNREQVEQDKADVRRILSYIYEGILPDRDEFPERELFEEAVYEDAPCAGFWYPRYHAGEKIREGETLGEIRDVFGKTLHICCAKASGVILYQTCSLNIPEGGPMIAYGVRR